jgi:ASCH domain
MDFASDLLSLPVLSVRQPWASYLVSGLKSVELRTWLSQYRGWLWIHAGKRPDLAAMKLLNLRTEEFRCGGLVGLAKVEEYHLIDSENKWLALRGEHLSPGHFGGHCYGWQFSDALSLPEIIKCPGELGLFHLSGAISEQVHREMIGSYHQEFIRYARNALRLCSQNIQTASS